MAEYDKVIICLANSRKTSGRCIAGRELNGARVGGWVRPVSARDTGEISEDERRFEDGRDPRVLDIVRIPMLQPKPHGFQTENHLIDPAYYWSLEGRATWDQVRGAVDGANQALWTNQSSSYNGQNDRVIEAAAAALPGSLKLIEVSNLAIHVVVEGEEFGNGKRRVRGRFTHLGTQYCLSITDPTVEREFLARDNGTYPIGHAIICVSLGEPYQGYAYKLIAAVIRPPT